MSKNDTYTDPATGRVYDLPAGDERCRFDDSKACNEAKYINPIVNGRNTYRRIFIRLRTPYETLTCRPIEDSVDFAQRAAIIEGWFNSVVRTGNFELTFEARQITDEEADMMEKGGAK